MKKIHSRFVGAYYCPDVLFHSAERVRFMRTS